MGAQHTYLLLSSLQYTGSTPSGPGLSLEFRELVAWLENYKIRQLAQPDRKALQATDDAGWPEAFQEYLKEVDSPIEYAEDDDSTNRQILDWLLHLATSLAYQDHGTLMQPSTSAPQSQPPQEDLHDFNSPGFRAKLAQLKQTLQLPDEGRSLTNDLQVQVQACMAFEQAYECYKLGRLWQQVARDVVAEQLLPSVESSQVGKRSREAAQQLASLDPGTFPLGFSTGDPKVDLAATIMRMLFIKDLRQLQTLVDETLVQVQEYTANPKTDSLLGRVGR